MVKPVDATLCVVLAVVLLSVAAVSINAQSTNSHFGFPSYQEVSQLVTGTIPQGTYSMQNVTYQTSWHEYGLVRAQTAFYDSQTSGSADSPGVFIVEFQFNTAGNATSFYKSQLFGHLMLVGQSNSVAMLNNTFHGAVYSVFSMGGSGIYSYYEIGHLNEFAFSIAVSPSNLNSQSLTSLANSVVNSMHQ